MKITSKTTIFSFLVFGVVAATVRNVSVTGTVTFEATKLNVSVAVYEANADTIIEDVANAVLAEKSLLDQEALLQICYKFSQVITNKNKQI